MKAEETFPVTYADIESAARTIKGVVARTPFELSSSFSRLFGGQVYLKLENLQRTGSFKMRGSYNKISKLTSEQKGHGVITASAGNHAQGVALSATLNRIRSVVVMPQHASLAKVAATKNYGAEVMLHGQIFDDALAKALEVQKKRKMTFIHGYNDPLVIAGQGTTGIEMCEVKEMDYIICPIGGGGLISGIAVAVKHLCPKTKIIGVQAAAMPSFAESVKAGRIVKADAGETIADGIAIKQPGEIAFRIARSLVDSVYTVTEDEITEAMFLLLERSKQLVEGAGAAPLALLLSGRLKVDGKKVGLVVSGGNVDLNLVRKMIMRGLVMHRRIAMVQLDLPDSPGAMKDALTLIAEAGATVLSLQDNPLLSEGSLNRFHPSVLIEVEDGQHLDKLVESFKGKGLNIRAVPI